MIRVAEAEQRPEKRRRGPRRSLHVDRVVAAALEIVDESGPEGLSIRSVAARLGVNPNALYTYVSSRAELEKAVVERVLADAETDLLAGADPWRERLVGFAISLRATIMRHPAVARLMMTAPMDGPQALLVGERMIGALLDGGLPVADAGRAAYALIVQVIGGVALEAAETSGMPPVPPEADRIAERRSTLGYLDADAWPHAAATIDVMAAWVGTEQFEWSLRRLLDGLDALVRAQAAGGR